MSTTTESKREQKRTPTNNNGPEFRGQRPIGNTRTLATEDDRDPAGPFTGTFSPATSGRSAGGALPTEDEIRRRAYEIYVSRGGEPGHEVDDWKQAERELKAKRKVV